MCPQKWNASASPGLISEPAVRAPATAITPAPTRERNPRREVAAASCCAARPVALARSSTPAGWASSLSRALRKRTPPALGGGEHRLQLRPRVERALGQHGPVAAHGPRER